jgi:hypothetical protein
MGYLANKLVVLDIDMPQLMANKIFDPKEAIKVSHTILPTCYLYDQAKALGIDFITSDMFFQLETKPSKALLFSHLITPSTSRLIAGGCKPVILTCQESPFVATRFYIKLAKFSALYKHSFLFSGMLKRTSKKTIYHQMFFPSAFNINNFEVRPFSQKKLLAMISGNKRMGDWKKNLVLKLLYGFEVKEIYDLRKEVVNFMASHNLEFDLYGIGWGEGAGDTQEQESIKKVFRGKVEDKILTLKNYKFAFCFENSIFPGYVTEKIFDVMFAGCIPIYNGAPDIQTYVPKECFIDFRDFESLEQLTGFIKNMDEAKYSQYMENIRKYLTSPAFEKFTQEYFSREILKILEHEFSRA